MDLRRLCNVAYAVLAEGVPLELRGELDRRLQGPAALTEPASGVRPPAGHVLRADEPRSRDEIAAANREAMRSLMGMMPGAARA